MYNDPTFDSSSPDLVALVCPKLEFEFLIITRSSRAAVPARSPVSGSSESGGISSAAKARARLEDLAAHLVLEVFLERSLFSSPFGSSCTVSLSSVSTSSDGGGLIADSVASGSTTVAVLARSSRRRRFVECVFPSSRLNRLHQPAERITRVGLLVRIIAANLDSIRYQSEPTKPLL